MIEAIESLYFRQLKPNVRSRYVFICLYLSRTLPTVKMSFLTSFSFLILRRPFSFLPLSRFIFLSIASSILITLSSFLLKFRSYSNLNLSRLYFFLLISLHSLSLFSYLRLSHLSPLSISLMIPLLSHTVSSNLLSHLISILQLSHSSCIYTSEIVSLSFVFVSIYDSHLFQLLPLLFLSLILSSASFLACLFSHSLKCKPVIVKN